MGRKYSEQRWTGVTAHIHYYCQSLLDGKQTEEIPAGYLSAAKRLIDLALRGAGDKKILVKTVVPLEDVYCYTIATRAMSNTGLVGTINETRAFLTELQGFIGQLNTADSAKDKIILEKISKFFAQIMQTGEMQRYVEYVHGTDDDDD